MSKSHFAFDCIWFGGGLLLICYAWREWCEWWKVKGEWNKVSETGEKQPTGTVADNQPQQLENQTDEWLSYSAHNLRYIKFSFDLMSTGVSQLEEI